MADQSSATVVQGLGEQGGAREDLSDIIHNIDPTETPMLTAAGSTTATGIFHEWLTDTLDEPGNNVSAEGGDATFSAGDTPQRLGNYTQIGTKTIRVTGTTEVVNKGGRDSEMSYQSARKARSLKNDVDYTISATNLSRNADAPPDGSSPYAGNDQRQAASFLAYMSTTATNNGTAVAAGTGTVSADGLGTTAWDTTAGNPEELDSTATTTLTQGELDQAIENSWDRGGKPTLMVTGPKLKTFISSFDGVGNPGGTGNTNTTRTDRAGRTIYATMDVYMSNFGTLNIVPSRHIRVRSSNDGYTAVADDTKVYMVDPEYLKVAYLRPWQQFDLAKTGDSIKREMLVEWTLEVCNQRAHSAVVQCAAG